MLNAFAYTDHKELKSSTPREKSNDAQMTITTASEKFSDVEKCNVSITSFISRACENIILGIYIIYIY